MRQTRACSEEAGSLARSRPRNELERCLGHSFSRPELLERALTHGSRAHEFGSDEGSNERLEFLGDAVLDLLVSERLMEANSSADEGTLSRARAELVNTAALAVRARALELGSWLRLGKSEEKSGGRDKESILADLFEAVLGAMYLDGGLEPARALVARELGQDIAEAARGERPLRDAKSRLQEILHAKGEPGPVYTFTTECGPAHAREFDVEVSVAGRVLGSARARSKRAAEQGAAQGALRRLDESAS